MGEFSPIHWLVVLIVIMVIFGPKRLPEIGKALGEAIREFKKSLKEASSDEPAVKTESAKPTLTEIEQKNNKDTEKS